MGRAHLERDLPDEELPLVVLIVAADLLAPRPRHARAAQPQLAKALLHSRRTNSLTSWAPRG